MNGKVKATITWWAHRTATEENIPRIGEVIASLMSKHHLTKTQAEDALAQYEEDRYSRARSS